jgi:uncharacterized protein YndB with AHSA1/START domain
MPRLILPALLGIASLALAAAAPVDMKTKQEADGTHTLVHEMVVDAPPAEVWTAISTAKGWTSWAVPVAWAPEPDVIETSYTPNAAPGDKSTIRQRLLARIPSRLLVFRTEKAPQGFPNFDTYSKVTSVFELEPAGEGKTRVRLTGAGYADSDAGRELLGFFKRGNAASLEWLGTRFSEGPIDWKKRLSAPAPKK